MEHFAKLVGSLLALVYHCSDRIVILGHRREGHQPRRQTPDGVVPERRSQGRPRPSPPATNGAPPSVRSLLPTQEHGTGSLLPFRRCQVPGRQLRRTAERVRSQHSRLKHTLMRLSSTAPTPHSSHQTASRLRKADASIQQVSNLLLETLRDKFSDLSFENPASPPPAGRGLPENLRLSPATRAGAALRGSGHREIDGILRGEGRGKGRTTP